MYTVETLSNRYARINQSLKTVEVLLYKGYNVQRRVEEGPYTIDILDVGACPKEEVGEFGNDFEVHTIRQHQRSVRDPFISGNLTVRNGAGMPGTNSLTFKVAKWDTVSGWRSNFMVLKMGELCRAYNLHGGAYKSYFLKHLPTWPVKCPIYDGTYPICNLSAHHDTVASFPSLPYGRFRLHAMGYYLQQPSHKAPRACSRWVLEIVEKVSSGG
ncbi:uncharacterized protein LOC117639159 [Thrips palmi]|uniref:Uncharacterized protein LOC117639159 n=1 Tax=Thrips palmi TaxID=161013 RepID=A0A6P8Y314_THRPL|nr:uncharacterized protein LOC117639159 [Thrips palmi]